MSMLVIDHPDAELDIKNNLIWLRQKEQQPKSVPIKHIDSLIVCQSQALPVKLLQSLSQQGKSVVCLDRLNSTNSLVIQQTHIKSVERRVKHYQYVLDQNQCLKQAKALIHHKISLQLQLLNEWSDAYPKHRLTLKKTHQVLQSGIESLNNVTGAERLLGHEGNLQKRYFNAFFKLFKGEFTTSKRSRQPPKDPVNAMLSLGYTLLYHDAVRACHKHGLDPYLGVYHQLSHGRYSLACDLMEPLRPAIDQMVRQLVAEQEIRPHHFGKHNNGILLSKEGRPRFFKNYHTHRNSLAKQLDLYANYLARNIDQTTLPKRFTSGTHGK